jgi:RNA polymerase sigma factor (TIGR02999 family)
MSQEATQITRLLDAASKGDIGATDQLLPLVYDELRRVASGLMSREKPGLTLQPTALVHEAYMRLLGSQATTWQNRAHFFGAAATAMRRILIDRARHVKAARVSAVAADTDQLVAADDFGPAQDADELIALDAALLELAQRDQRQHDVVMLRYFAGLTIEQTAEALSLSTGTVKNEWSYARAWLLHQIEKRAPHDRH